MPVTYEIRYSLAAPWDTDALLHTRPADNCRPHETVRAAVHAFHAWVEYRTSQPGGTRKHAFPDARVLAVEDGVPRFLNDQEAAIVAEVEDALKRRSLPRRPRSPRPRAKRPKRRRLTYEIRYSASPWDSGLALLRSRRVDDGRAHRSVRAAGLALDRWIKAAIRAGNTAGGSALLVLAVEDGRPRFLTDDEQAALDRVLVPRGWSPGAASTPGPLARAGDQERRR